MANSKYASLKDVARLAGTSTATVSYVLNESTNRYVSDELRKRVLDAAKTLRYVKSAPASSLKVKRSGIIAVMIPQFKNTYFTNIIEAIEKIADAHGYILSICNTFDDEKREKSVLNKMIRYRVDGYIIIPTISGYDNIHFIRELDLPYVVIDRPLIGPRNFDIVTPNHFEEGYLPTKHLIENGHRKIAFLGSSAQNLATLERYEGYAKALNEYSIPIDKNIVCFSPSNYNLEQTGHQIVSDLIDNSDITALVSQHTLAKGAILCLNQRRVKIPDQISVVIVGTPEWAFLCNPPLTCVKRPEEAIGQKAAELLFNKILNKHNDNNGVVQIQLPCEMINGGSVKKISKL